jgi:hypothetical protein
LGVVSPAPLPRRLARFWPLVAVLAVVALALGTGAFERRTDRLVPRPAGSLVDCGNLVLAFTSATAQKVTDSTGSASWTVVANGSVRNRHDEALAPITGERGNIAARDPLSGRTFTPKYFSMGASWSRLFVPPGDSAFDLTATFEFPADFRPGPDLELGLFRMEYTDNVVLGLGGGVKEWNVDSTAQVSLLDLPLSRLPDLER